jgi:hypothetical protein
LVSPSGAETIRLLESLDHAAVPIERSIEPVISVPRPPFGVVT